MVKQTGSVLESDDEQVRNLGENTLFFGINGYKWARSATHSGYRRVFKDQN